MYKRVLKQQRGLGKENVVRLLQCSVWAWGDRASVMGIAQHHSGSELSGRKEHQYKGVQGMSHRFLSLNPPQGCCSGHPLPVKGLDQMLKTTKKMLEKNDPILFQCTVFAMQKKIAFSIK